MFKRSITNTIFEKQQKTVGNKQEIINCTIYSKHQTNYMFLKELLMIKTSKICGAIYNINNALLDYIELSVLHSLIWVSRGKHLGLFGGRLVRHMLASCSLMLT